MFDRIAKGILVLVLTSAVLLGAYLAYTRYFIELQDRTVEICIDLNGLKTMAAFEKKPLAPILKEIRKRGVTSIGLFEETLPEANALGEIYYTKGSGLGRLKNFNPKLYSLYKKGKIAPERTYIYAPFSNVRKRIYHQLKWVLGRKRLKFFGKEIIEVDEVEEELRNLGLGISEAQQKFIEKTGFRIIPRVWNDPRYHLGNIDLKIAALKDFDSIIFDGMDILGYPNSINSLAEALQKHKIKYGYIEIIKQDGNQQLKRLMHKNLIRVHSIPQEELAKITEGAAVKRFVRAARERKIRLLYIRPFLPPQIDAYPVAYNMKYFGEIKSALEKAGFVLGRAAPPSLLKVKGWQILLLGMGVAIGSLFLLNNFINIPVVLMYLFLLLSGGGMLFAGVSGYEILLQKGLALLAAVTFPTLAVISSLSAAKKRKFLFWDAILIILNILAETFIGIFLLLGLLADYRFMLGAETFTGVKIALVLPIILVALYFVVRKGKGGFKDRITSFLNTEVRMLTVIMGLFTLVALAIFVARSGNFVLPVPAFEKYFRSLLESIFFVRPRTKEFLIGYPFLFLAAGNLLQGRQKWLWLFASIGAIVPISVFNSFSHIHTPIMISLMRTVNGLVLGVIIGLIVAMIVGRYIKK